MIEVDSQQRLYEVSGLTPAALLDYVRDADLQARASERRKFRLASEWCRVHEVFDREQAAELGEVESGTASDCDLRVGAAGTPMIASGCSEPFAAALGVTTQSGMSLLSDALDLEHRFPRLFAQVEDLRLPVWKARRVAQETYDLGVEAAAFVDEQLAARARGFGVKTILAMVVAAIARFHPDLVDEGEKVGKDSWDVSLDHGHPATFNGTSELRVTGDTVDLTRVYGTVSEIAIALGRLGDEDPLPVRRAKAIGILGDPDLWMDLIDRANRRPDRDPAPDPGPAPAAQPEADAADDTTDTAEDTTQDSPAPARSDLAPRPSMAALSGLLRKPAKVELYLNLSAADLIALAEGSNESPVIGEVERLGPVTLAKIKEWLTTGGASITPVVNRVIDLNSTKARDLHDPPEWMREQVILRDEHCVFPWCATHARSCDLDHIEPFDEGPDGDRAPPGQTSAENLAALCRRHHRAKTLFGWSYSRLPDGAYRWKDPFGNIYLVDKNGTRRLD